MRRIFGFILILLSVLIGLVTVVSEMVIISDHNKWGVGGGYGFGFLMGQLLASAMFATLTVFLFIKGRKLLRYNSK